MLIQGSGKCSFSLVIIDILYKVYLICSKWTIKKIVYRMIAIDIQENRKEMVFIVIEKDIWLVVKNKFIPIWYM